MFILNPYTAKPNTIIGGVGSVITTKSALATKLGISESIISAFKIIGSDIHCKISSNYDIPTNCFQSDLTVTKYLDLENKVDSVQSSAFLNATNLREVRFHGINQLYNQSFRNAPLDLVFDVPNVTTSQLQSLLGCSISHYNFQSSILSSSGSVFSNNPVVEHIEFPNYTTSGNADFNTLSSLKTLLLPNLTTLSGTSINYFNGLTSCELISMKKLKNFLNNANVGMFNNLKLNCTIEINVNMLTNNSGSPAAQLVSAKANRSAIVEFYDDLGNYVSTL